jgi:hypothetical protein
VFLAQSSAIVTRHWRLSRRAGIKRFAPCRPFGTEKRCLRTNHGLASVATICRHCVAEAPEEDALPGPHGPVTGCACPSGINSHPLQFFGTQMRNGARHRWGQATGSGFGQATGRPQGQGTRQASRLCKFSVVPFAKISETYRKPGLDAGTVLCDSRADMRT